MKRARFRTEAQFMAWCATMRERAQSRTHNGRITGADRIRAEGRDHALARIAAFVENVAERPITERVPKYVLGRDGRLRRAD